MANLPACDLCLNPDKSLEYITLKVGSHGSLHEVITYDLPKISNDIYDNISRICTKCESKLISYYNYKKQCLGNIKCRPILNPPEEYSVSKIRDEDNKENVDPQTAAKNAPTGIYLCDICRGAYVNQYSLIRHLEDHKNRAFECSVCGKVFSRKKNLNAHKKLHIDETCPLCKERFFVKSVYAKHIFSHNIKFKCVDCKKTIPRKRFSRHMRYHNIKNSL